MKDLILKALEELNISTYLITEVNQESVELFFIRKHLDMRRMKNFHEFEVVVYRDLNDGAARGFSSAHIYPSMTLEEVKDSLKSAFLAASFAGNKFYELPAGVKEAHKDMQSKLAAKPLAENALAFAEAAFEEDKYEDVFINSLELFAEKTTKKIFSSNGTDVSFSKWTVKGEFVAQCPAPQDVETYRNFKYDDFNTESLKTTVKNTLEMTRARAQATKAPAAGKYRVILSSQYMSTLFNFYAERAHVAYVYPKYSNYQVGTKAQGEDIKGDAITATLKATVPYSGEGIPMKDRVLLDKGTVKTLHGGVRFSYYLGIEPTGEYESINVEPGSVSFEDMKKTPYLHVVNFSDFQMDSFSGHFGGEIRLAFLFDGETVTPVTGGSINGSIFEVQDKLTFSSDMQVEDGYEGPFAVAIPDVSVAGE